ncbi:MBL fold metallo-hydrolase [Actinomycetes bacterium KLBMP 9797]
MELLPAAIGARSAGPSAERIRRSPQFRDGTFRNTVPASVLPPGTWGRTFRELLFGKERRRRRPSLPVPLVTAPPAPVAADDLHLTWYGHASTLVELDGRRVLLDPIWSERCSPFSFAGPRRLHPPPVPIDQLPPVDAVVISHDHYDHLDLPTIRALSRSHPAAPFLVPLGIGAHLHRWQVPADRIVELDWNESAEVAGLRFTATPGRHFSGRLFARDRTLWASWVVAGATQRLFYSGDTGYFDGFAEIGKAHGPFDASLMAIGAYGPAWPDIHLNPEQAVQAHLDLSGGLLIPVHWATFNLAIHAWTEPADLVWREAKAVDARLAIPRPGERVPVADPPTIDAWWQPLA